MTNERKTYVSEDGKYNLNPAKVFNVIADFYAYITFST